MALAAGGWALAQSPAQGSGQVPVPTAAQMGMGSQIPAQGQTQNAVLSQDEVRDQVPAHSAPLPHGEGARRMGERLRAIFDGNDWRADPSKPFERIPYYQALLSRKLPLRDEMAVRMELGNEQLRAGRSERAVETLEDLVKVMEPHLAEVPRSIQAQIHQELALAYLRLGEQENCIGMHNALSCNFPLHGGGIHKKTRGAEGAVREYTKALELNPESNLCRWLLNIAYQQLGRYPQDVPKEWLAPPELFASEYYIGYFPEMAALAGITNMELSGGAIVEDFDGDGLLDVMVSSSGPLDPMHFYHNNGDGTFSDRTKEAGLADEIGGLNLVLTDYNNDGHPDVVVLRGAWWGKYGEYPLSLLRNNGDGTFDDVTEEAGLLTAGPTQTAAWADYDGDGWLDLFVGHESKPGDVHPCQLFHNNHDGTFTQVQAPGAGVGKLGSNLGFVKGVTWGDYNNDGRPDLYVSTMFGGSFLFRNDGPRDPRHPETGEWVFTDVTQQAGLGGKRNTFPTWFFDYDNDGWLDVYLGLGESSYESLLPKRMFRNDEGRYFQDVTTSGGFGNLQKGHGIAFADIENNGNEDVFEELGGAFPGDRFMPTLYHNPGHGNHWVTLVLEGVKTNRAAYGARVTVTIEEQGRERSIYRAVGAVSSFGGNPMRQHIGVGKASRIKEIEVWWPVSGLRQHFRDVPVDRTFHIREGRDVLDPIEVKPFEIGKTKIAHPMHEDEH